MSYEKYFDDRYESYEQEFKETRRRRKKKPTHTPKVTQEEILEGIADLTGLEGGFDPTYQPSKHEASWLLGSLRTFYDQQLITDVLALVKGGKEASVYRCAAHPSTGETNLAAKVYRPRMFRSLSNDAVYRQGRGILTSDGHDIDGTDKRIERAMRKNSAFGAQVKHTSWLMHEFTTLQALHEAGAAVPRPVAAGENAILMTFLGGEAVAAPTLSEVRLDKAEGPVLFAEVMRNIVIMLREGMVHGDLSAYNILYWEGKITLIDFPQVVNVHSNPQAFALFERDLTRVIDAFTRYGIREDASTVARDLWDRFVGENHLIRMADASRDLAPPDDAE